MITTDLTTVVEGACAQCANKAARIRAHEERK